MNNKILLLLLFTILLASFVIAPCPPDCSDEEYVQMDIDQFKEVFKDNPLLAVEKAPELYVELLKEDPMVAVESPDAYEKAIYTEISVLNENKDAFRNYAFLKGVNFRNIEGDFMTFDPSNGMFVTTNSDKEEVFYLNLRELAMLKVSAKLYSFSITKDGLLKSTTNSNDEILMAGTLKDSTLNDGFFSYNGDVVELRGDSSVKLANRCGDGFSSCHFVRIFSTGSNGIVALPNGAILMKGLITIEEENQKHTKYYLSADSIYQNEKGFIFEVEKTTTLINTNPSYSKRDACAGEYGNCIWEKISLAEDGIKVQLILESESQEMKLSGSDGVYDDIIVRKINDLSDGNKIILHLNRGYQDVEFVFDGSPPKVKGRIDGLKTNLAHSFTSVDKEGNKFSVPWIIHSGKYFTNVYGEVETDTAKLFDLFIKRNDLVGLDLLLESVDLQYESRMRVLKIVLNNYPHQNELQLRLLDLSGGKVYNKEESYLVYELAGTQGATELQEEMYRRILDEEGNTIIDAKGVLTGSYIDKGRLLQFASSDKLREMIIRETEIIDVISRKVGTLGATKSLAYYLTALKQMNPELQRLALDTLNLNEGIFSRKGLGGLSYRWVLETFSENPEMFKYALNKMSNKMEQYGFNPQNFEKIYFDDQFEEQTKNDDFPNKYSIALSVNRLLFDLGVEINAESIDSVTKLIVEERKEVRDRIFLGKSTYYIPIAHDEAKFDLSRQIAKAREFGVRDIAATDMKGEDHKERFLQFVENSRDKGPTTIHFNNHGGEYSQSLSDPAGSFETSNNEGPSLINVREFGDALLDRGSLGEVNIIIDSCYSTNFKDVLYTYLVSSGAKELPTIVAVTNRGSFGYGGVFEEALDKVTSSRTNPSQSGLTGADFLDIIEKETFTKQDMSITVPKNGIPLEVKSVNSDEGVSKPAEREEQEEEPQKPSFIEIGTDLESIDPRLAESLIG